MLLQRIAFESIKTGTAAALAMMPFGAVFRVAGYRVGHYGPKFAGLFVSEPGPVFLFFQHIILGWLSAAPLVAWLLLRRTNWSPVVLGAGYGALYYVLVNSLGLPLFFGDELPWSLGVSTVFPSLIVHIVFGLAVGYLLQRFQAAHMAAK
jgi:hypothetical protein